MLARQLERVAPAHLEAARLVDAAAQRIDVRELPGGCHRQRIIAGAWDDRRPWASSFARGARAAGLAAIAFDQRGHGESEGALDHRVVEDVAAIAGLLPPGPLALRGSSLGGYVALLAAERLDADAVVAICPAGTEHLLRLQSHRDQAPDFRLDAPAFEAFLREHDLSLVVPELRTPMLLLHAEGDEQIPVDHSAALYRAARMPRKRLIALPGGHHRSIQHDPEMQGESLRFVEKAFAARG
ncbi:MAG: lysophospholipase [Actinobacteria bacterium]|nr:MAG: lysophospholipase [Actinomycetota bacterium]